MTRPLISVCIPAYRRAFLWEALKSVVDQDIENIEIVVTDNGEDDIEKPLRQLVGSVSMTYVRNIENIGMCANFRKALSLARGEYVTFLCADDLIYPGALRELSGLLQGNPDMSLAFSQVKFIGNRTKTTAYKFRPVVKGEVFIRRSLKSARNYVHLCTGTFRRNLAKPADIADLLFFDWVLWLRLGLRGTVGFVDRPLGAHRYHGANETKSEAATMVKEYGNLDEALQLFERSLPPNSPVKHKEIVRGRAMLYLHYADMIKQQCGSLPHGLRKASDVFGKKDTPKWMPAAALGYPMMQAAWRIAAKVKRTMAGTADRTRRCGF